MARCCSAVLLAAVAMLCSAEARLLLQNDAAGTVITGPHTEFKTFDVGANGCQSFETTPDRASFNYTSTITYAALPSGCSASNLKVTKVFARGACAQTRANNYAVKSLGIPQVSGCVAAAGNDSTTCLNIFGAVEAKGVITGPTSGQQIDNGEICWAAPFVYVFVQNSCSSPISVTVTNLFNDYNGACTKGDGDDGDATATASNSGGDVSGSTQSSSGLSPGAKAGIAVGVIVGVLLIVGVVLYICCFQLRKN